MDDPQAIAGRIGDIAKGGGDGVGPYRLHGVPGDQPGSRRRRHNAADLHPAGAVESMNNLVATMLNAGVAMARCRQANYDQNMMMLADNVASIIGRGITQAAQVAGKAAASVEKDGIKNRTAPRLRHRAHQHRDAAHRRDHGGRRRRTGPVPGSGALPDPFTVADNGTVRQLKPLSMAREDTGEDITAQVWFDPANKEVLMPGMTQFRLVANSAGLPSGVYCGEVEVTTTGPAPRSRRSRLRSPRRHRIRNRPSTNSRSRIPGTTEGDRPRANMLASEVLRFDERNTEAEDLLAAPTTTARSAGSPSCSPTWSIRPCSRRGWNPRCTARWSAGTARSCRRPSSSSRATSFDQG